jgi:uncharacterized protein YdhG (YjbR/CyaY superfamily)
MKTVIAKSVNEYMLGLPEDVQLTLEKLRQAIKAAAPKAEEVISYQMPAYKYNGMLVYFAAFKDHCSFFPASKAVMINFANELKNFKTSTGTIQFTVQKPLPVALVKKIVKQRVKENEEKAAMKKLKKKG